MPSREGGGYDLGEFPATQKGGIKGAHRNLKDKEKQQGPQSSNVLKQQRVQGRGVA